MSGYAYPGGWFSTDYIPDEVLGLLEKAPALETRRKPGEVTRTLVVESIQYKQFLYECQDCRRELFDSGIVDAPMLKDSIWFRLYPKNGVACLECTEQRLGRPLQRTDLKDVPFNFHWIKQNHPEWKPE